jgi:hypothetical protein
MTAAMPGRASTHGTCFRPLRRTTLRGSLFPGGVHCVEDVVDRTLPDDQSDLNQEFQPSAACERTLPRRIFSSTRDAVVAARGEYDYIYPGSVCGPLR